MTETFSTELPQRPVAETPRWRVILKAVAAKHHLSVEDILGGGRKKFIIDARREAMVQMRESGLEVTHIARVCRRERTTVLFHTSPGLRANKLEGCRRRRADKIQPRVNRMQEIIAVVPVGADSAKTSREIWRTFDCWSENTIASRLMRLADIGSIKSRKEPIPSGFRYVYWRDAE